MDFSGVDFLGTAFKFRRTKRNSSRRLFASSIKRAVRHFDVVVVQWRQRNVQKKRDARANLLFFLINLLLFDVLVTVAVVFARAPSNN